MQERVFDQVPELVEISVVFTPHLSVLPGRDHYLHARRLCPLNDGICIVTAIREQNFGVDSLDQSASMCTIRRGTLCDKDSDRHTMRIHGQMYLGVEPSFVRFIS